MNSKDALEDLFVRALDDAKRDDETFGVINRQENIRKCYDVVSKDLEALEILKRVIEIPREDDFERFEPRGDCIYLLGIKYLIDEKEYDLLKKVLD